MILDLEIENVDLKDATVEQLLELLKVVREKLGEFVHLPYAELIVLPIMKELGSRFPQEE
jgi:hypothetical protein